MAAAARVSEVKAEGLLRGACAALAAAAALLVGLSTQTETVLLVRKKATVKDVQALWVLAMAAAAAAGYHLLQLLKCLYLGRVGGARPCRRSSRALAWTCLLLDKTSKPL
uniref:CASP-like protein n=1 Tax=Zea mays TaxID=4577 RepID=A0A804UJS9_MAIZE